MDEMPDLSICDISRRAIEELFEGRHDREFAQLCIKEELSELGARWERLLGLKTSYTVTVTDAGFRVVLAALKNYGVEPKPEPVAVVTPVEVSEIAEELDSWDDDELDGL